MPFDAVAGQVGGGAGPQNEAPVGSLGQQQFSARLAQQPPFDTIPATTPFPRGRHHGHGRPVPAGHHPVVAAVEPVAVVAPLAPAGWRGTAHLQLGLVGQGIPQAHERQAGGGPAAQHPLQEGRPFKPPVAKQFGIERRHQQGRPVHHLGQLLQLLQPALDVMLRVVPDGGGGGGRVVGLLGVEGCALATDPAQLQAEGPLGGQPGGRHLGLRQIPTQVAVEFAIAAMAGVAVAG